MITIDRFSCCLISICLSVLSTLDWLHSSSQGFISWTCRGRSSSSRPRRQHRGYWEGESEWWWHHIASAVCVCACQNGNTPLHNASNQGHVEVVCLLEYYMTRSAKWRRRRVCVWLSSELSGGDNILFRFPADVARICGSYLWFDSQLWVIVRVYAYIIYCLSVIIIISMHCHN